MASSHLKHAAPNHPILPVFAERWSPYAYDPRPVERAKLRACLEAGRWAASSYNEQPWTFILAERTNEAEFKRMLACLVEGNQTWAKNAGVLMLTVVARNFVKNGKPNKAAEHDMGMAAGNLVLQATALGLQGHQMIGIEPAKVRAEYQVPEGFDPHTALALGYPANVKPDTADPLEKRDLAPRTRKLLSEIVIAGTWGQSAKLE
ncbi:MAG TPA: nitroreductase family protein [Pirellulaceae bacterium]|nr:nitroreductase family protein [Pirellulaceae bacterium]